jgi:hypothetical protein
MTQRLQDMDTTILVNKNNPNSQDDHLPLDYAIPLTKPIPICNINYTNIEHP